MKIRSLIGILIFTIIASCTNPKQQQFALNGTIKGVEDGKIVILKTYFVKDFEPLTAIVNQGKFEITGNIDCPHEYQLVIDGVKDGVTFVLLYPDNSPMTIDWDIKESHNAIVTGGKIHEIHNSLLAEIDSLTSKLGDVDDLMTQYTKKPSDELRVKLTNISMEAYRIENSVRLDYFKNNPNSYYTAIKVESKSHGMSAYEMEVLIKENLDPSLESTPIMKNWRARIAKMKSLDISVSNFADVENVNYKTDKSFLGEQYKDVIYLGSFKNNDVCALQKDGTILMLDSKGKFISSFKTEGKGVPSSIAIDNEDQIFFIDRLEKLKKTKVRGRSIEKLFPFATGCTVYSRNGEKLRQFNLANTLGATGVKVIRDTMVVADYYQSRLAIHSAKTGEQKAFIEGMRACCGILDISINKKNEILVGNLGAFRAESYDFNGKQISAFGKRGKGLDDFHGCCNPVNVAHLSNGAIVTVEKDPTRIKIYGKEGAKQIAGIEELVKGCAYIPMTVDGNDNLYLASKEKGLVKCVSIN